jgi:hypothetical protein
LGDQNRLGGAVDAGGETGINHGFVIDGADKDNIASKKLNLAAELRCKDV